VDKPDTQALQLSWRVAGNLSLWKGKLRIRALMSRAYRSPGTFYRFNNYRYFAAPMEPQANYKRESVPLNPEVILNGEAGILLSPWPSLQIGLDVVAYRLSNSILFDQNFPRQGTGPNANLFMGYYNTTSQSNLQQLQGMVAWTDTFAFGSIHFSLAGQRNIGTEAIAGLDTIPQFRSVPDYQGHAALVFAHPKLFRVGLQGRFVGPGNTYLAKLNDMLITARAGSFFCLDASLGRSFGKRIFLYGRVKNLLNAQARGISTDFISTSHLPYIPQERRFVYFGVNFML
jgi:hypothetical protein